MALFPTATTRVACLNFLLILIENQNYPLLTSTCRTQVLSASRRLGYF